MATLEAVLEKEALTEVGDILAQADARGKELIGAAEEAAAARLAACRRRIERQARSAEQRARSSAELTLSTARMKARGEVMEIVRGKVMAALSVMPSQPGYGEILEALADQAVSAVEAAKAVAVHPEDRDRLAEWARRKGLALREDPAVRLGVRIECGNGKTVTNTLPTRFHRAWDTLAAELARLFWEEGTDFD